MDPLDPAPPQPTPPDALPASPPPLPRFCSRCGLALAEPGGPCAACTARESRKVTVEIEERLSGRPTLAAFGLYGAILLIHLATSLVWAFAELTPVQGLHLQWSIEILDALVVAVWCLFRRRDVVPIIARPASPRWFVAAFLASFVTWGVATILMEGVLHFFPAKDASMTQEVFEAGYGWPSIVLSACVQPGIIEELAFRGVVLGALLRLLRPGEAIAVSAAMFAFLHLTPIAFPHLILIGAVLGWFRVRTGSIYPGVLLHFSHNLWCCIAEQLDLFGSST